jgi:hypothetical protein
MKRFQKPQQPNPRESAQHELYGLYCQSRDILTSVGELYLKAQQHQKSWAAFALAADAGSRAARLLEDAISKRLAIEEARKEEEQKND